MFEIRHVNGQCPRRNVLWCFLTMLMLWMCFGAQLFILCKQQQMAAAVAAFQFCDPLCRDLAEVPLNKEWKKNTSTPLPWSIPD